MTRALSRTRHLALILVALMCVGCGRQVIVRDEGGKSIEGVTVGITYPSFTGPSYLTDRSGVARIGKSRIFDELSLSLWRDGYDTDTYPWQEKWPLNVTLHPGGGHRWSGNPMPPTVVDPTSMEGVWTVRDGVIQCE